MSNHTLLTIGAFMLLTSVLLGFYRILGSTGDDIGTSQDLILATTITTSYLELANGLAFDEITDTSHVGLGNPSSLTHPSLLGTDSKLEDSMAVFNDFDDFNGRVYEKAATRTNKRFKTSFTVSYVELSNVDKIAAAQTFLKRMDLKTWRSYPPPTEGETHDTLRMSITMGYFHFD